MDLDRLVNELDFRAVEMLRTIAENGGSATTPEIRERTGLDNSQVRYRRQKLAELDLLTVSEGPPSASAHGSPPSNHELTDAANKALSAGLYSQMPAPEPGNFEELVEELTRLRTHIDRLHGRVDDIEHTVSEVRSDHEALRDEYEERIDGAENIGRRLNWLERHTENVKESIQDLDDKKKDKGRLGL